MIAFKGKISKLYRKSNDRVVFENENKNAMSELNSTISSFVASDQKDNIDSNMSIPFAVTPSSD